MKIGWIGVGRMGAPMAARLLRPGYPVSVWNRTRAKAETEELKGAAVVDRRDELAGVDVLFTMLNTGKDVIEVSLQTKACSATGEPDAEAGRRLLDHRHGRVGRDQGPPRQARCGIPRRAGQRQPEMRARRQVLLRRLRPQSRLRRGRAAPPRHRAARRDLCRRGRAVADVQDRGQHPARRDRREHDGGDAARPEGGVSRHAFLEFLNHSVAGSIYTRYKTPALVNLDFTTTFPPTGQRKDIDLGLAIARELEVPMPVTAATREMLQSHIGINRLKPDADAAVGRDFAAMFETMALLAGVRLESENVEVSDGLEPEEPKTREPAHA